MKEMCYILLKSTTLHNSTWRRSEKCTISTRLFNTKIKTKLFFCFIECGMVLENRALPANHQKLSYHLEYAMLISYDGQILYTGTQHGQILYTGTQLLEHISYEEINIFNQISYGISIKIKLWLQFSIQFKEGSVLIKHQHYTFSNIS